MNEKTIPTKDRDELPDYATNLLSAGTYARIRSDNDIWALHFLTETAETMGHHIFCETRQTWIDFARMILRELAEDDS